MKKVYQKPAIYVENFALSQSIAQNCGLKREDESTLGKPNYSEAGSCGWEVSPGLSYWIDAKTNCTNHKDANGQLDGQCYNNPSSTNSLFAYS